MILAAGRRESGYLKKPVISVCEKWKFNAISHGLWKIAEESCRGFVATFSTSGASGEGNDSGRRVLEKWLPERRSESISAHAGVL